MKPVRRKVGAGEASKSANKVGMAVIDAVERATGETCGKEPRWVTIKDLYAVLKSEQLANGTCEEDLVQSLNIPPERLELYTEGRQAIRKAIPASYHYIFPAPEIVFNLCNTLRTKQLIYTGGSTPVSPVARPPPRGKSAASASLPGPSKKVQIKETRGQELAAAAESILREKEDPPIRTNRIQVHEGTLLSAVDLQRMFEPPAVVIARGGRDKVPAKGPRKEKRSPPKRAKQSVSPRSRSTPAPAFSSASAKPSAMNSLFNAKDAKAKGAKDTGSTFRRSRSAGSSKSKESRGRSTERSESRGRSGSQKTPKKGKVTPDYSWAPSGQRRRPHSTGRSASSSKRSNSEKPLGGKAKGSQNELVTMHRPLDRSPPRVARKRGARQGEIEKLTGASSSVVHDGLGSPNANYRSHSSPVSNSPTHRAH